MRASPLGQLLRPYLRAPGLSRPAGNRDAAKDSLADSPNCEGVLCVNGHRKLQGFGHRKRQEPSAAPRRERSSGPGARSSWQSLCGCRRSPVCSVRKGMDHFGEFRVPTHAVAVASDVDDVAPVEQAASTRGPSTETPAPCQLVLHFELGLTYCAAKEFP